MHYHQLTYSLAVLAFTTTATLAQTPDNEARIQAKLQSATVFLNRAQLMGQATATLPAGTTRLIIDNLPANTDPQSIQVSGKGDAVIQGVQFRTNFLSKTIRPPALQRLDDSLLSARDAYDLLLVRKKVLEEEQRLILANKRVGGDQVGTSVKAVSDMAAYYRDRLTKLGQELLTVNRRIEEAKKSLDNLTGQVNEQNAKRDRPVGEVEVTMTAKSRTPVTLDLSYVVGNAGWTPIYDVRVKDTKSPATLAFKANVYQNTGFDWQNIRLTLSTANPALPGTQPQLSPDYVRFWEPQPILQEAVAAPAPRAAYSMRAKTDDAARAFAEPEKDVQNTADFTEVTDQPTNVSFAITMPYTILSNNRPQVVDIRTNELPATYRYQVTPKLDTDAFLTALVTGWDKLNLLNGKARIYFDGTYVGESWIRPAETKDTLQLSLGRDKRIIATREQIQDNTTKPGFLGNSQRETHAYRIGLRNTRQEPVEVVVFDQIPVSTNSQIEVSLVDAGGATLDKETGKLTYRLTLKPGENRDLTFRYDVKYPKDKKINP